ncbi:hypothetical protein HMN09_00778200 [Mycena chlorophos]|uniref:F-box domain-containing protein n=1 Tax=Mycena chlorophos TaxID=658473 RepID=A0A8H6SUV6_MYCCL|nr:hypothetical protein HMN09_00778200 [Mycena chlorophos]
MSPLTASESTDVVLAILHLCDVATVVAVSQTCQHLKALAFQKSVWVALCDDLRRQQLLDWTTVADVSELTAAELVDLVKRLVQGPRSWSPAVAGEDFSPAILREITIPARKYNPPSDLEATHQQEVHLLPDGEHLLWINNGRLECWSVGTKQRVWVHTPSVLPAAVIYLAAEKEKRGRIRVIAGVRTFDKVNYVEILEIDPQRGTAALLLTSRLFTWGVDNPFNHFSIHGNYAAICHNTMTAEYDRTNVALFNFEDPQNPRFINILSSVGDMMISLVDSYVFVANGPSPYEIRVISVESLAGHWVPTIPSTAQHDPPGTLTFSELAAILSLRIQPRVHAIYTLPSPLRRDHYRLFVGLTTRGVSYNFHLDGARNAVVALHERQPSTAHRRLEAGHGELSYSGHTLDERNRIPFIVAPTDAQSPTQTALVGRTSKHGSRYLLLAPAQEHQAARLGNPSFALPCRPMSVSGLLYRNTIAFFRPGLIVPKAAHFRPSIPDATPKDLRDAGASTDESRLAGSADGGHSTSAYHRR